MAADRLYSSCLWCEDPEKAKGLLGRLLVQWERRPKPKWIDEMTNDVSFCRNCMIEYNRAKEENSQWEDGLWRFDVQRIQSSLTKLLNSTDPVFQQFDVIDVDEYACVTDRLHTPLMELIAFPDYLRDAEIGRLFIQAFRLYANRNGRELEVEERLPGLYLLLVHPYQKIRRWALKAVKPLGPIDTNDFDDLESVFKLVFSTIGCSLFSGKCSAPKMPDHLLCDLHDLWVGIVMMMTAMDSHTLKSRFLVPGRFQPVVPKVVSALREQPTFWPAFQCFVLLLERIKSRIWEMAGSSPQAIFHYITTNGCYIEELQQMAASPNSLDESLVPARSVDGDSDGGNDEAEMATADVLSNSQIAYNWNGQASVKRRGNCFHSTTFGWFLDFLMSFANDVKTALDVFPLLLHFLLNSPERISPNHFPEPDLLQLSLLFVKCTSTLLKLIHYCLIEKKFEIISSSGDMWIPFLLDCSQVKKRFTRGGQPDGSMIEIDELSLIAKQSRQLLISLLRKTPESILRNSDIAGLASDENPRTRRTCVRVHYLSENEMQRFVGRIKDSLEKLLKFTPKPEPSQAVDADADSVVVIDLTECSGGESPDLFSPQTSSSSDDEDSQDRVKLIQWRKRRAVLLEPDSDSSDEDFVRPQRVSDDVLQLKKKYRRGKETTQDEDSTSVLLSMCRKMSYRPKFIIPLTLARVKLPEPEPEPELEPELEPEPEPGEPSSFSWSARDQQAAVKPGSSFTSSSVYDGGISLSLRLMGNSASGVSTVGKRPKDFCRDVLQSITDFVPGQDLTWDDESESESESEEEEDVQARLPKALLQAEQEPMAGVADNEGVERETIKKSDLPTSESTHQQKFVVPPVVEPHAKRVCKSFSRKPPVSTSTVPATAESISRRLSLCSSPSGEPRVRPTALPNRNRLISSVLVWKPKEMMDHIKATKDRKPPPLPPLRSASPVLRRYSSFDRYLNTFEALILLEVWEMVIKGLKEAQSKKPVFHSVLSNVHTRPDTSLIRFCCEGEISSEDAEKWNHLVESDLVQFTVTPHDGQKSSRIPLAFGVVEHVSKASIAAAALGGVRLTVGLQTRRTSVYLPRERDAVEARFLTSLTTSERQYSGLINIYKNRLIRDVLSPRAGKAFYGMSAVKSFSDLKVDVKRELYNESQERAIATAALSCLTPFMQPNICLLQGPPGTGKTHTIIGFIKTYFLEAKHHQIQTGKVQAGKPGKPRLLLCAPSNGGIDELVRRMMSGGLVEGVASSLASSRSAEAPRFRVVRIGRSSSVHQDVKKVFIENVIDTEGMIGSSECKDDQATSISHEIEAINKELRTIDMSDQWSPIIEDRRQALLKQRGQLEEEARKMRRVVKNRNMRRRKAYSDVLLNADIVCATLSGSGNRRMTQMLKERRASTHVPHFSCVVVDEAAQCSEVDVLIPLQHETSKLVLVGDPAQLPATVLSPKAAKFGFGQSLFERVYSVFSKLSSEENPILMLTMQYRMHPEICRFPSSQFYNGKLESSNSVSKNNSWKFKSFLVFNARNGIEENSGSGCISNRVEINVIVQLCRVLFGGRLMAKSIGIITPYSEQKKLLSSEMASNRMRDVEIGTVDGFQGKEKDVIIMSCVRARHWSGAIGFLSQKQRLNVALTRAKYSLFVVGHCRSLQIDKTWRALIDNALSRKVVIDVDDIKVAAEYCRKERSLPAEPSSLLAGSSNEKAPAKRGGSSAKVVRFADHDDALKSKGRSEMPEKSLSRKEEEEKRPNEKHEEPKQQLHPPLQPPQQQPLALPSVVTIPGRSRARPEKAMPTSTKRGHPEPESNSPSKILKTARLVTARSSSSSLLGSKGVTTSRGSPHKCGGAPSRRIAHAGADTERLRKQALRGKDGQRFRLPMRSTREKGKAPLLQSLIKDIKKMRK